MIIAITSVLAIAVIAFILTIRPRDLPAAEPESPFAHLDDRKAAIYENLRDLQFEYRVGKLSDADYQNTKKDLQKELAAVLAEVDRLKAQLAGKPAAAAPAPAPKPKAERATETKPIVFVCPSCGATFEKSLKFCGECGKSMKAASA
ncbi:MAG: hypothetical protein ABSH56_17310 [Bryobacteraceae bacterium]